MIGLEVAQGSELRTYVNSVFNLLSKRQVFTQVVTKLVGIHIFRPIESTCRLSALHQGHERSSPVHETGPLSLIMARNHYNSECPAFVGTHPELALLAKRTALSFAHSFSPPLTSS